MWVRILLRSILYTVSLGGKAASLPPAAGGGGGWVPFTLVIYLLSSRGQRRVRLSFFVLTVSEFTLIQNLIMPLWRILGLQILLSYTIIHLLLPVLPVIHSSPDFCPKTSIRSSSVFYVVCWCQP